MTDTQKELAYPPKVLITKIGLDGHDRGGRVIAAALRDAGMEVIYTGPWKKIPEVVNIALEEDVDVIGVSSLATDHLLIPKLVKALEEESLSHIRVIVGGIIPDADERELITSGVSRVFHPGINTDVVIQEVNQMTSESRTQKQN